MKTKEELNALKDEVSALRDRLSALNDDELAEVVGGVRITSVYENVSSLVTEPLEVLDKCAARVAENMKGIIR